MNDGANAAGDFPIGIGVEDSGNGLAGLHARDVRLVDVDFNFVGVHVDDGGDAGAGKAAACGIGRDHFAYLSVFGDDDAAIRRADSAVVDGLLRLLDACLRADDLRLSQGDLGLETVGGGAGI